MNFGIFVFQRYTSTREKNNLELRRRSYLSSSNLPLVESGFGGFTYYGTGLEFAPCEVTES